MCSDIAISVKNLTKTYRIFGHPGDRIKQAFTFGRMRFHREFTALKDVSFEIKKGETVGIIGRNGSGKSTLLQLICGILKPTSGTVQVNGRISALLELGAGFNPEFTGRENVYFQGSVMGLTGDEMTRRFDDIVAFADIGEFIEQPVRTYSSGMFVRLAFAVAVSVDPEILVVDEALSVGDEKFQRKVMSCLDIMRNKGITILIVSHSSSTIGRLCKSTILLENGELSDFSAARDGIGKYHSLLYAEYEKKGTEKNYLLKATTGHSDSHSLRGRITRVHMKSEEGVATTVFQSGQLMILCVDIEILQDLFEVQVGISFKTIDNFLVFGTNTSYFNKNVSIARTDTVLTACFKLDMNLCEGAYFLSVALATSALPNGFEYIDRRSDMMIVTITDDHRVAMGVANLPVSVDFSPASRT